MIHYLSEDKKGSPFVKLFNSAYECDVLECSGANTKLVKNARRLASGGDYVIVYMDMVPDNESLVVTYNKLFNLYVEEGLEVVVMPIVCAEYNFVWSIHDVSGTVSSVDDLFVLLSKSVLYKQSELSRGHSKVTTFERFCKLFCDKCLNVDCCSIPDGKSEESASRRYFSGDCECVGCSTRLTLAQKATKFVQQYGVYPGIGDSDESISWEDVIAYSRVLVDEYNSWAERFNNGYQKISKR